MLAARQQDAESLRRHYGSAAEIILCIDGLQPEKGHETLYVVRELTRTRVWFAEPLLSATEDEVRRLITKAREWAESLGMPVGLWMSDKQEAFVKGIAAEFPRRAAPLLRQPLPPRPGPARPGGRQPCQGPDEKEGARPAGDRTGRAPAAEGQDQGWPHARRSWSHRHGARGGEPACCRGRSRWRRGARLSRRGARDPQRRSGGPPHPPGLRMAEALHEVQESLQRNLDGEGGGSRRSDSAGSRDASGRASTKSKRSKR
jgi:hypothetical protein